ncbi:MAG: O-antigen ligase family protein [Candidatus Omnitrophota bacterium]|nr:O-antigen ligase family protein [Candidatus Omnitrophota bacterium]
MLITIANILIACRPFICSLAYLLVSLSYSFLLVSFLLIWILLKGLPRPEIRLIKYPAALFVLALLISTVFAPDKYNAIKELFNYLPGVLLFLFAASLSSEEKTQIIRPIIQTSFIIGILAIYQYFWGIPHLMNYLAQKKLNNPFTLNYITAQRAFFPFVTPNTLAGYLAMMVPLILAYRKNWLIISVIFVGLLLTKSIGALLSLFLGLGIYFYLRGRINRKAWAVMGLLLIILVLVFMFRQSSNQPPNRLVTFSLNRRIIYWQDTLRIIRSHLLTGVGIGNLNLPLSLYTHNSYLQIWAEMGILGIFSLVWLIIASLKSALRNLRSSPYKTQIAGLFSANAIFLIHNIVDFSFFLPEVAFLWWITLGLLLSKPPETGLKN